MMAFKGLGHPSEVLNSTVMALGGCACVHVCTLGSFAHRHRATNGRRATHRLPRVVTPVRAGSCGSAAQYDRACSFIDLQWKGQCFGAIGQWERNGDF